MPIRPAITTDHAFILGLAERFTEFPLPATRTRAMLDTGIRRDLQRQLGERPDTSFPYVLEEDDGTRAGFLHLQLVEDFFTGGRNCHVSDLAVAPGHEGRGHARRMLAFAEAFAREHGCERMTLAVFPGNARARALYESEGWQYELLRMAKPL
ncbi:GNAT family N-acetyltransferase [Arenimonas fontis]|uniref:GNAT family N-acetyltransferase n=1 Tax=Arenimonas fontis TaxID=2608255 RepID=A0A5B2ZBN6_9GAMM|nr:GNAT family N-acetyltransferase [Arenimonas fontis]KAA2284594.1 GNAT family N-acetyltransferase [Arenimonas fontis]